jgi:Spy/CpxP family protein refolding chaperone
MKDYLLILIMMLSVSMAQAQPPGGKKERQEQIEKAKISYITERLSLTETQSPKFWPVYNEFSAKRRQLLMEMRKLNKENKNPSASDEQIKQNLSLMLDKKQAIVGLEKEYLPKLLAVINPRQVEALHKAEKDFMKMLRKKIEERKN